MDYLNTRDKIKKMSAKIFEIEAKAQREYREMSRDETSVIAEMEGCIEVLKKDLPEASLTNPLGHLNRSGGGGSSSGGPFLNMGEQCQSIAFSARPGAQVDQRLYQIRAAAYGTNETVPSEGGFLLQENFTDGILQNVFASGKVAALCRRIQISSNANSIKIPGLDEKSRVAGCRWGGVQSYWLAEAAEITKTKPTFRQIELILKKQAVLIYCTDEMLQDVAVLQNVLSRIASDEISFTLEDAIINGLGSGQPSGILTSNAVVSVPKETGQKKGTIVAENIFLMWSRLLGNSRASSVWLINSTVEPQLYSMSLSVGTGGVPCFMPAGGISGQPYMSLFGRPIIVSEHCPTLGTLGDIILGDFTNGYILAEKGGVQSAMSISVRFEYDESVFRFTYRVDGEPVLSQPITPYKGGSTYSQSHFVALADRLV